MADAFLESEYPGFFSLWADEGELEGEDLFSALFEDDRLPQNVQQLEEARAGTECQVACSAEQPGPLPSGGTCPSSLGRTKRSRQRSKPGVKLSRWGQRKQNMKEVEQDAAQQASVAGVLEALNRQLRLKANAMQYAVEARDKQVAILQRHGNQQRAEQDGDAGLPGEAAATATASPATMATLADMFRAFVAEASMLLLEVDAQTQDPGPLTAQLSSQVQQLCTELGTAFVLNPRMQLEMMAMRADRHNSSAGDAAPGPEHWRRVAAEARLTQAQLDQVAACWELNQNILEKLQADILAMQRAWLPGLNLGEEPAAHIDDLQQGLSAATLKQGIACRAMSFILFTRILSPVQTARLLVHSFPFFPDTHEVITQLLLNRGSSQPPRS